MEREKNIIVEDLQKIGLAIIWVILWLMGIVIWLMLLPLIIIVTFFRTFSFVTRYDGGVLNPLDYIKWFVRLK